MSTPTSSSDAPTKNGISRPKGSRSPRLGKAERGVRQEIVLLKTICGMKAKEIASELQCSMDTVRKDLAEARRAGILVAAREKLAGLTPKALAVIDVCLENGDKDIALAVLEGLGLLGKNVQVQMMPPTQTGEETFDIFRARVTRKVTAVEPTPTAEVTAECITEETASAVVCGEVV